MEVWTYKQTSMHIAYNYMIRASCYHDGEQHLRRHDHRRQGRAVREGIARYRHQGGGQRQAGQGRVV